VIYSTTGGKVGWSCVTVDTAW